jgi:ribose/xylose/arabinose/galactoside ABC-type transport system permease subunit
VAQLRDSRHSRLGLFVVLIWVEIDISFPAMTAIAQYAMAVG